MSLREISVDCLITTTLIATYDNGLDERDETHRLRRRVFPWLQRYNNVIWKTRLSGLSVGVSWFGEASSWRSCRTFLAEKMARPRSTNFWRDPETEMAATISLSKACLTSAREWARRTRSSALC